MSIIELNEVVQVITETEIGINRREKPKTYFENVTRPIYISSDAIECFFDREHSTLIIMKSGNHYSVNEKSSQVLSLIEG